MTNGYNGCPVIHMPRPRALQRILFLTLVFILFSGCAPGSPDVLRLATTTSTSDSGLLDAILPDFEAKFVAEVDVIAVGTGQALALGEAGDVDVVLVHSREREDAFVAEGHGTGRWDVMYNDFIIVGPAADPAGIAGMTSGAEALAVIAAAEAPFASRGDESGTHSKEMELWAQAEIAPSGDWYSSLGQGMGATLLYAQDQLAYTLTDRGTYLSQQDTLPELVTLVGGASIDDNADPSLFNPYGVIPINPNKGGIHAELALDFVNWLISAGTQEMIADYGVDIFGMPLFYPNAEADLVDQ